MTLSRQLRMLALGLLVLGPGAVAWSQTRPGATAGTGVEPRYLIPCGRVISISDLGDDERRDCAAPLSCAAPPVCSARPVRSSCCAEEPCDACRARCAGPFRTAFERLWQQLFACPSCECQQPSCAAPPPCVPRPACGCDVPSLPRDIAPAPSRPEGDPFRDDSVEPSRSPKQAASRARQPALTEQPTLAPPRAGKPVATPPRGETIKSRVALNEPRLGADE